MKEYETISRHLTTLPTVKRVGHPNKFESVEVLEEQIEAYFRSCFVRVREHHKEWIEGDAEAGIAGHFDYEWRDARDSEGNFLYEMSKQPTITGLAVYLDTNRQTLLNYEEDPKNEKFFDTIKKAKAIIHDYAEQYLHYGKNQTGAIFSLKNNFGWVDRTEQDISSKGKALSTIAVEAKAADILKTDDDDKQG